MFELRNSNLRSLNRKVSRNVGISLSVLQIVWKMVKTLLTRNSVAWALNTRLNIVALYISPSAKIALLLFTFFPVRPCVCRLPLRSRPIVRSAPLPLDWGIPYGAQGARKRPGMHTQPLGHWAVILAGPFST